MPTECRPDYQIRYNLRGVEGAASAPISELQWGRVLDDVSTSQITHVLPTAACCDDLGRLEPWADTVTIERNGEVVWYGWLQNVRYTRNTVTVQAADALQWLKVRIPHASYKATVDQAQHFLNIWNLCMDIAPVNADVNIYSTGVVDKRSYPFTNLSTGWGVVSDMFDSALDVTCLGNQIHAGALAIANTINLSLADFEGDVAISKSGGLFANSAYLDASGSIVGHYPNNPLFTGDGVYPLVEDVVRDEEVQDQTSANAGAKARVDASRIVPRIVTVGDALVLAEQAPVSVRGLVPSALVNLDSTGLCYAQKEAYRLGRVQANVSAGVEKLAITLIPVGTLSQLQGFGGDDEAIIE